MTRSPVLSVVLCTYQGAAHLEEQLDSLAGQTRPPDELVVGDDGSDDGTLALLDRFAATAPFPVVVHRHERLGPNGNFADAIERCRGDLVALCDQDDRWHPDRLEEGVRALDDAPTALLAFSDGDLIGPTGQPLGRTLWSSIGLDRPTRDRLGDDPLAALLRRPMATGCTMTFRRELLDLAAPLPLDPGMQHDRWLALCAAARGPLVAIDRALVDYRLHPAQHTGLGPLSTAQGTPRGRLHWTRWRGVRRTGDGRLDPAIGQAELLARRLAETGSPVPEALVECQRLLEHRASLPPARLRRIGPIARHLRAGRYRRFSTGWVGALADLVRR